MAAQPILQISYSLANIENAVHQFWQYAHQYQVFAFSGDMGAGKTTFITALCHYLAVEDAVSSPTFSLINEYTFQQNGNAKKIYHMDWYRLKDEDEAIDAGVEDTLLCKDSYSIVEWPEKAQELLPKPHLWIHIANNGDNERSMNVWVKD